MLKTIRLFAKIALNLFDIANFSGDLLNCHLKSVRANISIDEKMLKTIRLFAIAHRRTNGTEVL